ncbi:bifunctional folylpolyglutamate synthase/dihydrofolate synthase [Thioalkalivibrio denitrificans]|uniref:Dihydrofolate synthase/folylpolyglutamate synthase n=1 Tax=Thioalkalivibrio denitrificans TaxID=108003 RepID=A0A1V3NBV1_9GAMM|nr:bifunctional tetrahydrofolate synthase/dihydrofolate synthase [Thioalkalivibrio denitrificans]OOG22328.1 bifunctional folylpolyglutamate synthase/dihydrofolate synthase [Thioalkalivibrio denitrificans]
MRFETLGEWLAWQETLHPKPIDLGLERVARVAARLGRIPHHPSTAAADPLATNGGEICGPDLLHPPCPVITVGGTNGKGSTTAMLEAIYRAAGYDTGMFTSPHLLRYNERVRLNGVPVDDARLCEAFAHIDAARGDETLSYFEFGTLAALWLFQDARVDVMILEVGLGGRLDAVNIVDADAAIITSVGLDHQQWLGADREGIGAEKAGIFRAGRPAICGDPEPPDSVPATAQRLGAHWMPLGTAFGWRRRGPTAWDWHSAHGPAWTDLPLPALAGEIQLNNAACALAAVHQLLTALPVERSQVCRGLRDVRLPARFQEIRNAPSVIVDVAHNPLGAKALAATLAQTPVPGQTFAVIAMMADKDMEGVITALAPEIDCWFAAGLPQLPRAAGARDLYEHIRSRVAVPVFCHEQVRDAYRAACARAGSADRILVCGSFHTAAEVLAGISHHRS